MHRINVLTARVDEDVALVRYAIQAAHASAGMVHVLDLLHLEPAQAVDTRALLEELQATVRGNGQRLAAVAPEQVPLGEGVERHETLLECLRAACPVQARSYAVEMSLPARVEYLGPVRALLGQVARSLHGDADAFQVEILVDELCLNAVENSPSTHNSYDLRFECEGHELVMEVTNVFDDSVNSERIMHKRLASFDDSGDYLGERGRGLFLVARIADGLQIRALEGDRIRVSITKRLRGEPVGDGG